MFLLPNVQRMHLHGFVLSKGLYPMLVCQPPKKEFRPKHKKELDQLTKLRHMKRHFLFGRPIFRCYVSFGVGYTGLLIFSHGLKCFSGGDITSSPFLPPNIKSHQHILHPSATLEGLKTLHWEISRFFSFGKNGSDSNCFPGTLMLKAFWNSSRVTSRGCQTKKSDCLT